MANNQITFGVGFQVDKSGLNQLKTSLNEISKMTTKDLMKINPGSDLSQAKKDLREIMSLASTVESALNDAFNQKLGTVNIQTFNKALKDSGTNLQQVYNTFSKAGVAGQNAFRNLAMSTTSVNLQLKTTKSILDRMAETLTNTIKWNLASGVVNALTGSVRQAFGFVKNLDTSLNDIRIVTEKSADEMKIFAENANAAAKSLGQSTRNYTDATLIYYQQGKGDAESQRLAEVTLKAANVTGQTGAEVSEQLTAIWNGYKVSAAEAELYIDKVAAVAAATAADLEELSTGMSKVASAANAMGVDVDQLNAQLATIVSVTRQAPESVGTALKTIYARMTDLKLGGTDEDGLGLGKVSGQLADVGIQILDESGNLRDMGTVIEEVAAKWNTWGEAQRIAVAQVMAGTRQYNNLVALFDNWDMYTDALETSANAAGTLNKQQNIYMESTKAHLQQLSTAQEDLYKSLLDTDTVNTIADVFRELIELTTVWVDSLGGGIGVLKTLGSVGTMVFSKQIANGINNILVERERGAFNQQQVAAALNTLQTQKNIAGLDNDTLQLLNQRERLYNLSAYMNPQDFNQLNQKIGSLTGDVNELARLKEKKQIFDEIINKAKTFRGIKLIPEDDNHTQLLAISNTIEKLITHYEQLQQQFRENLEYSNFDELSKKLMNIQTIINDLSGLGLIKPNDKKELEEYIKKYNELLTMQKTNPAAVPNIDLTSAAQAIEAKIKSIGLSTKQLSQQVINEILTIYGTPNEATAALIRQQEEKIRREQQGIIEGIKIPERKVLIESFTKMAGAASSILISISNLSRIKNIISNDALTGWEKFQQVSTSILMSIPMITTGLITLGNELRKIAGAAGLASSATASFGTVVKTVWMAMPAGVKVISALIAVVGGLVAIYDKLTISADEAKQALEKSTADANKSQTELDNLEEQLKGVNTELEKLYKISDQDLTITNQQDIANLEKEKTLLETKLKLQQDINREASLQQAKDAAKAATSRRDKIDHTSLANQIPSDHLVDFDGNTDLNDMQRLAAKSGSIYTVETLQWLADNGIIPKNLIEGQSGSGLDFRPEINGQKVSMSDININDPLQVQQYIDGLKTTSTDAVNGIIKSLANSASTAVSDYIKEYREQYPPLDNGERRAYELLMSAYPQGPQKRFSSYEAPWGTVSFEQFQQYQTRANSLSDAELTTQFLSTTEGAYFTEALNFFRLISTQALPNFISEVEAIEINPIELDPEILLNNLNTALEQLPVLYEHTNDPEVPNAQEAIDIYEDDAKQAYKYDNTYRDKVASAIREGMTSELYENIQQALKVEGSFDEAGRVTEKGMERIKAAIGDEELYNTWEKNLRLFGLSIRNTFGDLNLLTGSFEAIDQIIESKKPAEYQATPVNLAQKAYDSSKQSFSLLNAAQTNLASKQKLDFDDEELFAFTSQLKQLPGIYEDSANAYEEWFALQNKPPKAQLDYLKQLTNFVFNHTQALKEDLITEKKKQIEELKNQRVEAIRQSNDTNLSDEDRAAAKEKADNILIDLQKVHNEINALTGWSTDEINHIVSTYDTIAKLQKAVNDEILTQDEANAVYDLILDKQLQSLGITQENFEILKAATGLSDKDLLVKLKVDKGIDSLESIVPDSESIDFGEMSNADIMNDYSNTALQIKDTIMEMYDLESMSDEDALTFFNPETLETIQKALEGDSEALLKFYQILKNIEGITLPDFSSWKEQFPDENYDATIDDAGNQLGALSALDGMSAKDEDWAEKVDDLSYAYDNLDGAQDIIHDLRDGTIDLAQANDELVDISLKQIKAVDKLTDEQWKQYKQILRNNDVIVDGYETLEDYIEAIEEARDAGKAWAKQLKDSSEDIIDAYDDIQEANKTTETIEDDLVAVQKVINDMSFEHFGSKAEQLKNVFSTIFSSSDIYNQVQDFANFVESQNIDWSMLFDAYSAGYNADKMLNYLATTIGMTQKQVTALMGSAGGTWQAFYDNIFTMLGQVDDSLLIQAIVYVNSVLSGIGSSLRTPVPSGFGGSSGGNRRSSGSGKGGGGGGGSNRDPDKMDFIDDDTDPYHDVNIQLEKLSDNLEDLSDQQDKLLGNELLDNLNEQLNVLEKQKNTLKEKMEIAKMEAAYYKEQLENEGAIFGEDGQLANYQELMEAKEVALNKIIEKYNKMSASEQEKYKDTVEEAKEDYEKFKENLETYEETINDIIPDIEDQLQEAMDQAVELEITKFKLAIDVRLDMSEAERDWNEFKSRVISSVDDDDFLGKAQHKLEDLLSYYNTAGTGTGSIQSLTGQINDTIAQLNMLNDVGWASIYGDNHAQALEDLQEYTKELQDQLMDIQDLVDEINEAYYDTIDAVKDDFDKQIDSYEHISDLIEHDMEVIQLLYGEDEYEAMEAFYEKQAANNLSQLESLRMQAQYWKEQMEQSDPDSEEWAMFKENYDEAIADLNSTLEDSLDNIINKYTNTINSIFSQLNNKITGGFGLDYVGEEWDLMNENADQYLDTINAMYAIQDTELAFKDAIKDSDSISTQQRLNDLMERELKYLREKDKLTQYDVDRANMMLDLELKRIALEEAQQNKTKLRLRRDSQGNYSYQYVSDADAVAQAQEELLAAQNELYNFDKNRYQENLDQMYSTYQEFQEKLLELYEDQTLSDEERDRKKMLLVQQYGELINGITQENISIRENLEESAFTEMAALYNGNIEDFQAMTDKQKEIFMSDLIPAWIGGVQQMTDVFASEGGFVATCIQAFEKLDAAFGKYKTEVEDIENAGGLNTDELQQGIDGVIDYTSGWITANDELITTAEEQLTAIQNLIAELALLQAQYKAVSDAAIEAAKAGHSVWQQDQDQNADDYEAAEAWGNSEEAVKMNSELTSDDVRVVTGKTYDDGSKSWAIFANDDNRMLGAGLIDDEDNVDVRQALSGVTDELIEEWLRHAEAFDTGGYTGEWAPNGKVAILHEKELILNQTDTKNILSAVDMVRQITANVASNMGARLANMMGNIGSTFSAGDVTNNETIEQSVHIEANFPNATSTNEIQSALENLVNIAAQRAMSQRR